MNVTKRIDEVKVLAPVRDAMRGWHRCDAEGLIGRITAAYAALVALVDSKALPAYHPSWRKAHREIEALRDRLIFEFDRSYYEALYSRAMAA